MKTHQNTNPDQIGFVQSFFQTLFKSEQNYKGMKNIHGGALQGFLLLFIVKFGFLLMVVGLDFFLLGGGEEIEYDDADHTLDDKWFLLHLSLEI